MDEQTFLTKISEITETDKTDISLSTSLSDLSIWDSMAAAAFVAIATEYAEGDLVSGLQIAKSVGDLFDLVRGVSGVCKD